MAAAGLAQIPDVDIDSDGVFKYVLIRVYAAPPSGDPAVETKEIVRGYKWAEYHGEGGAVGRGRGLGLCGRGQRVWSGAEGGGGVDPVPGLLAGWLGGREASRLSWRRGAAVARPPLLVPGPLPRHTPSSLFSRPESLLSWGRGLLRPGGPG